MGGHSLFTTSGDDKKFKTFAVDTDISATE